MLTNLLTYLECVTRMLDEGKNVDFIYKSGFRQARPLIRSLVKG